MHARILLETNLCPFGVEIRNNTVFIVMPPDLGLAELLQPLFQTRLAFLGSLMSLSVKLVSGLPFFWLNQNLAEFAPIPCKDFSEHILICAHFRIQMSNMAATVSYYHQIATFFVSDVRSKFISLRCTIPIYCKRQPLAVEVNWSVSHPCLFAQHSKSDQQDSGQVAWL